MGEVGLSGKELRYLGLTEARQVTTSANKPSRKMGGAVPDSVAAQQLFSEQIAPSHAHFQRTERRSSSGTSQSNSPNAVVGSLLNFSGRYGWPRKNARSRAKDQFQLLAALQRRTSHEERERGAIGFS